MKSKNTHRSTPAPAAENNIPDTITSGRMTFFQRLGKYLPLLIALLTGLIAIKRELWFDEALTLMNFVIPMSAGGIYNNYAIPNNHIVYNMMLKIFAMPLAESGWCDPVTVFRMFSLAAMLAALAVIMDLRGKIDSGRVFPGGLVLSVMATSMIWMNYATAIRGYALSFFWTALALYGLYDIFHDRARRGWTLFAISSVLAAGSVPSNLLALAAAVLYAIQWLPERFWRDKRFYIACAVPLLALIVFYAPIAGAFLNTFSLGEGFPSRWGAIAMVLGMYASCFGLLLIFAPWGICKQPWRCYLTYLIWLMPILAILILHRAPFPRIFVPLLPVLAMLVIDGIAKVTLKAWKAYHLALFLLLALCVQTMLIMSGYAVSAKVSLDPVEDDFFHPYYMQKNYRPSLVAHKIAGQAGDRVVFISFNSDPLPMRFYSVMSGLKCSMSVDVPNNSVKSLPDGSLAVLHTRRDDVQAFEERFNCRLQKVEEIKYVTLYRVKSR
ncbi:MAG: hypothetical protein E7047_04490 [Lentisphaerae bacterium]|nr:hypothetical protein [Lentisphaerota bacterium]